MTREGHTGAFATEAKEGGAGHEAGVGAGAVGGWAWGLGVGWAEGFCAVAALGGGLELLTLAASSLTWPASEAKCYNFGHSLFFILLSLTSLLLICDSSSFSSMISYLRQYDVVSVLDSSIPHSSCTRMTLSYIMRRQPASLVCP